MSRGNGDIAELAYRARHLLKYQGRSQVRPKVYDDRNADFRDVLIGPVYISNANSDLNVMFSKHVVMISEDHQVMELRQEFLRPALEVLRQHMVLQDLADV